MKGWTGALRMYRPIDKASIIEFAKGVEAPHGVKATIKTRKASCRCGELNVTYKGPDPERRTLCHCNSCQLRTGTAFSIQGTVSA